MSTLVGVAQGPALRRVYVWDLLVRVAHWLIALSIMLLSVTGLYMGRPFLIVTGEAGQHFVMGTMKAIHFYSAIVFVLSVLARIVWMFAGSTYARWNHFVPVSKEAFRGAWGTLQFYLLFRAKPPPYVGHNPVAGMAYTAVFFLYFVEIASGLGLYAMHAYDSPMRHFAVFLRLFGGAQSALWVHHVVMWLLLGFVAHHIASAVLTSRVEKNGTIDSIFSGFKFK